LCQGHETVIRTASDGIEDIIFASQSVEDCLAVLKQFREDNSVYQRIFSYAAEVNGGDILMSRLSGWQQHHHVPATSAEEYFRLAVFLPFIDTVTAQLEEKLRNHTSIALQLSGLLLSVCASRNVQDAEQAVDLYRQFIPANTFRAEYLRWQSYW